MRDAQRAMLSEVVTTAEVCVHMRIWRLFMGFLPSLLKTVAL